MTTHHESRPPNTKSKRGLGLSTNVLLLLFGCFLTLAMTILHGLTLDTVASTNINHVDAFVSDTPRVPFILPSDLRLGSLDCEQYGGPSPEHSKEMVYWQDIPSDSRYVSPFHAKHGQDKRYMTFEPDEGGFNNVRMAMEVVLTLAHASGRTLVLPPEQEMYLLYKNKEGHQRSTFTFNDFFPMKAISRNEEGLDIITMDEFLKREGITGRLKDHNGQVSYPPFNRTNWDGMTTDVVDELQPWQQTVSIMPEWDPEKCLAAFPSTPGPEGVSSMHKIWDDIGANGGFPPYTDYVGNPVSVRASATDRLKENAKARERLCIYDEALQKEPLLHFHGKNALGGRLLAHFYGFLFFEDWKKDLWTKRFVRDHVRYVDEIQCAAARIVHAVREHARERDPIGNPGGDFDGMHVRRGEFQYKRTRISSKRIHHISKDKIPKGATVYVATDERDKTFFDDMASHYDLVYLDDFKHLLGDLNTNLYGMVDQLVASRSRVFFGCWFSTFTSYITRLRGYHSDRLKLPGFAMGVTESYYYAFTEQKLRMREYWPVTGAFYSREFPTSWRNIDHGIEGLEIVTT